MEQKKIPFWEDSYKNDSISAFGIKPNPEVEQFIALFNKNGGVLEAGCGEAKNAFYLTEKGFKNVYAFDLSENAINKVHKIAEKRNIQINAFVQDLCTFEWKYNYDLIISYGTLHFVDRAGWHNFISNAKEHTNKCQHLLRVFRKKIMKKKMGFEELLMKIKGIDYRKCSHCDNGRLITINEIEKKRYGPSLIRIPVSTI